MNLRTALLILLALTSAVTYGQFEDVELNMDGNWHEMLEGQGVKIEYRYEVCDQIDRQVGKYVLKVENSSLESKQVRFAMELYQNGDCINCHRIDKEEYQTVLSLDPGQIMEGVCGENSGQLEYFSHFMVMVPGMSGKHLSKMVITNLEIE